MSVNYSRFYVGLLSLMSKSALQRYMECTKLLKEIYEDKDGQRKEEVALLSGPNEFVEFYNRLKQIKEFYKKHPNEVFKFNSLFQYSALSWYISVYRSQCPCLLNLRNWLNRGRMVPMRQIVSFHSKQKSSG